MGKEPSVVESIQKLERKFDEFSDALKGLKFDKNEFSDQVLIGLAASIAERCHSVHLLLKNQKTYDAEILLRSLLEHVVSLRLIRKDKRHLNHFRHVFTRSVRTKLQQTKDGNPFFHLIESRLPVEKELEEWKRRLSEIESAGGQEVNIQEQFHQVEMKNEYESIYRSLSAQAHPTYAGIIKRHLVVDTATGELDIVAFSIPNEDSTIVVADTTVQLLDLSLLEIA